MQYKLRNGMVVERDDTSKEWFHNPRVTVVSASAPENGYWHPGERLTLLHNDSGFPLGGSFGVGFDIIEELPPAKPPKEENSIIVEKRNRYQIIMDED
jgi:hypothetical protein